METADSFLDLLAEPAKRALQRAGIKTLDQLSWLSEKEVLELHGMGPGSINKLRKALDAKNLSFRKK
ncbi:MAG TPA: DNA-directed RNA polymerase subunit alpha C-terminal domain-containing protein [Ohtaekwangia sp.]|uniref:DNA-directed RNA polymerase subunit alpha C-terminal domain-containing protein n=1 Tax=Ohtaekwangia sp. TaxID=2066019 RepID=UPI002F91FC46